MKSVALPSTHTMPVFGLGTWRMGERADRRQQEVTAIRHALELGVTLIDTAEMYGEGGAEEIIAEAIGGQREKLFIISKVYPHNASRSGVIEACERSLRRLNSDYIDLYLLHWPGQHSLQETFDGFHDLRDSGKIRDFGVSNFDIDDLQKIPKQGQQQLACNQVFYNLSHRQAEWAVTDWCQNHSVPIIAYSPLDQAGSLLRSATLSNVASRHSATNAQIALAWLLHQPDTVVIPKSSQSQRIKENFESLQIQLSAEDLAELETGFPAPNQTVRLGMR